MGGFGVAVRAEFAHRALSRDCTANVARVFRPEAVRLLLVFWMSPPRAIFSPRHGDKSQKTRAEIPKNRSGGAFENCSESKGGRNRSKTRSKNSRKIGQSLPRRNL